MKQWIKCTICFLTGLFLILSWSAEPVLSAVNRETLSVEKEREETEDEWGEDQEKKVILTAVETKKERAAFARATVSAEETVDLNVGETVYYGSYSTNYFDVNGKLAYCLEPLKQTPESGKYEVEELRSGLVRKGLYYVYGGPGYEIYKEKYGSFSTSGSRSVDEEYCMSHCILSYLYSGDDTAFTGLSKETTVSLKRKAEWIKGLPDPPKSFYAFLFNMGVDGQTMGGSGEEHKGSIEIYKQSDQPEWVKSFSCYSLEGAVFGIYEKGEKEPLWKLVTDENGYARKDHIPIGTYEVLELSSPPGHQSNETRTVVEIEKNRVYQYECVNHAQYYPVGTLLKKIDKETGANDGQGHYSLAGAEFSVKYYGGYYEENPAEKGIEPDREWKLKTDETGELRLDDSYKLEGDAFILNGKKEAVLPLGTVTFEEIKAPFGYEINPEIKVEKITSKGKKITDTLYQIPTVEEKAVKGNIQLVKFREDAQKIEDETDQKTPLQGIVFTITSKTTGWSCEIETDENGYATTKNGYRVFEDGEWKFQNQGGLLLDTYLVQEKNPPADLDGIQKFEVEIKDEKTSYYILENKKIFSPVKLVKKDAETGKIIPLAGAEFELLDENKKPITMQIHYPVERECRTFRTDESGSFVLPEKLPVGTYYFRELVPPKGYLLNEELIGFTITEEHQWENPFLVEVLDPPIKGTICIEKMDSNTQEKIAGVQLEVRGAEDIYTSDGKLRVRKGELVSNLVTDAQGMAQTGELYLGKYEIREVRQAPGYVLLKQPVFVNLTVGTETVESVKEEVTLLNEPTLLIIEKIESGTEKTLEGVTFELQKIERASVSEESQEQIVERILEHNIYKTDEAGVIRLEYLEPGEYRLVETETITGYAKDRQVKEFIISEDGTIDGKSEYKIQIENPKTQICDTKAVWKTRHVKEIEAGDETLLLDKVTFSNLDTEKEYLLKGILMDAESGETLLYHGDTITAEKRFRGEEGEKGIEMEFEIQTAQFPNRKIVVFEVLYENGVRISAHEDLKDEDQTVTILKKPEPAVPTGDETMEKQAQYAMSLSCTVILACITLLGKRKRYKNQ